MRFLPRPSKIFIFDMLERELGRYPGEIGLDAGSAQFKNRNLFKTKMYYGLDYDLSALRKGLLEFNINTRGILADLQHIENLPSDSVNTVVSTNTLYHLPEESICRAIAELSRVTRPDGVFILELPLDGKFDVRHKELSRHFTDIRNIYYKNIISRAYEYIFEHNGELGSHVIAGSRPFLVLSWLISRIEYTTCCSRFFNKHVLIIATKKSKNTGAQSFDLGDFPLIDGKIYEFLVNK